MPDNALQSRGFLLISHAYLHIIYISGSHLLLLKLELFVFFVKATLRKLDQVIGLHFEQCLIVDVDRLYLPIDPRQ
ncbi:MAG: hypothetical protein QM299_02225, partial [Pseudomonadota bacterium]|nr:hypothetical protein [Pseudomonadota bacterium]